MNQKDIEAEIILATENRKNIENRLKTTQQDLSRLQQLFEDDIAQLKSAQTHENNLQESLYSLQKQQIKEVMSVDSLKKVIGDATPFFMRIKEKTLNKVQGVKDFLDGTALDNQWINEKYEEYKEICIQKGEEIKSKQEFQKIALAIKETENLGETSIYDKLSKISKEVGHAKDTIKNVLQTLKVEEKIGNLLKGETEPNVEVAVELTKKSVFKEWIDSQHIPTLKQQESRNIHEGYVQFVASQYGEDKVSDLTYGYSNFITAINKSMKAVENEPVVEQSTVRRKKM